MRTCMSAGVILTLLILCFGCEKKKGAPQTPPLHNAAEAGDLAPVQALIAGGADVNARDRTGRTALHEVVRASHDNLVPLLISAGADVNAVDAEGNTPLLCALDSERPGVARLLIDHGANVNTANVSGQAPLSKAIRQDDPNLVDLLIAHGADVNAKHASTLYSTPLQLAAERGNRQIVESLLAAGAEINAADMFGRTALHEAIRYCGVDANVATLLLDRGADAKTQTHDGETLLHVAAQHGDDDIVARLITGGADVNAVDKPGDTPVLYAAKGGYSDIVRRLVAEGASVNVANKLGQTPLTEAVRYGEPNLVTFLISKGADVNARYRRNQYTALHLATACGWKEVADLLIDAGAQVNAGGAIGTYDPLGFPAGQPRSRTPREAGQTPTQIAMKAGHRKIVQLLAKRGADPTIHRAAYLDDMEELKRLLADGVDPDVQDEQGWTALRWAVQEDHVSAVQLLLAHGADVNGKTLNGEPLLDAIWRKHTEVAALLIANGSALNGSYGYGMTALEMCASSGLRDLIELLISKGVLENGSRDAANEAMLNAAWAGHKDIVELLLAKGISVNAKGHQGGTALHRAAAYGHQDIVELLLAKGASINAVDEDGKTAITCAMEWDHRKTAELLAARGADLTIHSAAYIGDANAVRHFIARGADINAMYDGKKTPLYLAAQEGNIAVAELLIAQGAEVDRGNEDAWLPTPLYAAAQRGHGDMVKLLIRHGADARASTLEGRTPLHEAVRQGHREVAELLLDNGVEVNARAGWEESTPLREAALRGHVDVVELLLNRGAEIIAGEEDIGIVLPDPRRQSVAETTRLLVEAYAPYTIVVRNPQAIRSFLNSHGVPFDDVWVPAQADIQGLDSIVKASLEKASPAIASSWLDREYVLRNFHRYDREFGGFTGDRTKYVICSMILSDSFRRPPLGDMFTVVFDGGSSVVQVIFNAESRSVTKIECNGQ